MSQTMTRARQVLIVLAAAILALAVAMPAQAFAQTVGTASTGTGTITISNAAKGETYSVYKLFNASVTGTENGSISYSGTIPDSLSTYFTADDAGNITATDAAKSGDSLSENAIAALATWANGQSATATAESDGSDLEFVGLSYGYYVVKTTQGDQAITVNSTNPNASIVDKNQTTPVTGLTKTIDDDNVYIGQTVTYTVKFGTANYSGAGENAKLIESYTISDTPAINSLTDIAVTGIYVDDDGDLGTKNDQINLSVQQFVNNAITVPWASGGASLYKNGAYLVITYTAKVADTAAIAGSGNTNTVAVTYTDESNTTSSEVTTNAAFKTYAIAIKKVNQSGADLSGATFQFPFYVKEAAAADGSYVYAGTNSGTGLTNELTTPDSGLIIVKGLEGGTEVSVRETNAPAGYNALTAPVSITPVVSTETATSKTVYLDADGNEVSESASDGSTVNVAIENIAATAEVVVNKTGIALPSTGGIGTTILYVVGGVMVLLAGVFLVSRRRASKANMEESDELM